MAPAASDVSVVICCYTEARWDDLREAIDSVARQTVPPREIAVIVDHNPRLYERLRAELSTLLIVENREGRGLSGGRNTGIAVTTGAVVAFLDDDAAAEPDWLQRLTEPYADPQVLGVGGRDRAVLANGSAGAGSPPSSTGWSGAATRVCPRRPHRSVT